MKAYHCCCNALAETKVTRNSPTKSKRNTRLIASARAWVITCWESVSGLWTLKQWLPFTHQLAVEDIRRKKVAWSSYDSIVGALRFFYATSCGETWRMSEQT